MPDKSAVEQQTPIKGILLGMDLFFVSKIQGTASALGIVINSATSIKQVLEKLNEQGIKFLLIDLEAYQGDLEFISTLKAEKPDFKVVAFGSHVNTERLNTASSMGTDAVMPRSKFSMNLPQILQELIQI